MKEINLSTRRDPRRKGKDTVVLVGEEFRQVLSDGGNGAR